MLIRQSEVTELPQILALINDAAQAYRGVIPDDRWREPYMPVEDLNREIAHGVSFWVAESDGAAVGVMGIQDRGDVALIRHAYVSPAEQRKGIGVALLRHIEERSIKPILIGTWAAASWAIAFYRRNGFSLLPDNEASVVLRKYWSIPERQIATSVVLANRAWTARSGAVSHEARSCA